MLEMHNNDSDTYDTVRNFMIIVQQHMELVATSRGVSWTVNHPELSPDSSP